MPKFYSEQAYQKMVDQYVANGFSTSAAEKMVNDEEATSMKEYELFSADATDWVDDLDNNSYYIDIDN